MKKSNEELLKHIDEQIEKWTFRKVWMQKCDLETEVGDLREEILQLRQKTSLATHQAKLLYIEPFRKCKHEPFTKGDRAYKACTFCGVELKATWSEK